LIPFHKEALAWVREQIWELYQDLKAYKNKPSDEKKAEITSYFENFC